MTDRICTGVCVNYSCAAQQPPDFRVWRCRSLAGGMAATVAEELVSDFRRLQIAMNQFGLKLDALCRTAPISAGGRGRISQQCVRQCVADG